MTVRPSATPLLLSLLLLSSGCPRSTKPAGGDAGAAGPTTADARVRLDSRARRATPPAGSAAEGPKKVFAVRQWQVRPKAATFAAIASTRVRQAATRYDDKQSEVPAPPMSLTASDGTGLELVALKARGAIEGPLALTELHLTFRNPKPRVIEGRFAITLPGESAISRFAMKLASGQWQEAEVVERQRARRIYEDFLHRRQDPALLEKKAGNQFRARIFPIPASGMKEIKITYSQQLARTKAPYRLPLLGLPAIKELEIVAFLGKRGDSGVSSTLGGTAQTHQLIRVAKQNWRPDRDFVVSSLSPVQGLRHGNLAVVRLAPELGAAATAQIKGLLLMVDTSASRAAGFAPQISRLGELLAALAKRHGAETPVEIVCFDQVVSPVYAGTLGGVGDKQLQAILARRALGASNLYTALRWAAERQGPALDRVLLFGDGVATAGLIGGDDLHRAAKQLASKIDRIDAVVTGGIRDEATLRRLVRGTVARDGVILDGDQLSVDELARRLSAGTISGIEVAVEGAKWIWPSRLDGVQPGDEVLVYADLPPGAVAAGAPLKVSLSGATKQQVAIKVAAAKRPLLERAWVKARIDRLIDRRDRLADGDPDMKQAIRKQIIALSTKHRVLTDYTALLVLETEHDYRRYGIDRRALADILTVGANGVALQQHRQGVTPSQRPGLARDKRDANEQPTARHRGPGQRSSRPAEGSGEARPATGNLGGLRAAGRGGDNDLRPASPAPAPAAERESDDEAKSEAPARRFRRAKRRAPSRSRRPAIMRPPPRPRPRPAPRKQRRAAAYSGRMAKVMSMVARGQTDGALVEALRWRAEAPGDVMALIALGEALTSKRQLELAARAYGSIIDLFPSRADMRRFAGERLEALGKVGQALAADSYAEAVRQRPDHPSSHRLLAFALVRLGLHAAAFEALAVGVARSYPSGRFRGVPRILREDLGLIAAAWIKAEPKQRGAISDRLLKLSIKLPTKPSLRFVLNWETDANDVDFHIHDRRGGHAWYSHMNLESGGRLYADVTTGYGPECFAIEGKARAYPYRLQAHYYSRGPMGYGMGKLEIIQHDGQGGLKFEQRPFVVMNDRAYVDLGRVRRPL